MKALYWVEEKKVDVIDVEEPQIQPGIAKVRIDYASICASDTHIVSQSQHGIKPPFPLGYEACGTIAELGVGLENKIFSIGDKVAILINTKGTNYI